MTETKLRKKNTGEPTNNGGEFGSKAHAEADIALGAGKRVVSAEVDITWIERDVLPTPRHKVPRDVYHDATVTVSIPEVSVDDTELGFTVTKDEWVYYDEDGNRAPRYGGPGVRREGELEEVERELRVFNGQLYCEVLDDIDNGEAVDATPKWIQHQFERGFSSSRFEGDSEDAAARDAQHSLNGYISIDGKVWRTTREPVYRIMTFGMGSNHGGTSISLDSAPETEHHAADDWYFPATQLDEAVAAAVIVAQKRGDDKSIDRIRATKPIQVQNPDQVAKSWRPAPRLEYTRTYELTEENFATELARFKQALRFVPGAVEKTDDGFGGKTSRVNYRALSEQQAVDYRAYIEFGANHGLL